MDFFRAPHRTSTGTLLYGALLAVATYALLHPSAADAYRTIRMAATPGLNDSSGHLAHMLCYTTLTVAALVLVPNLRLRVLGAFLVAHGVLTESLQSLIPGRTFDFADMLCNGSAVCIVLVIAEVARSRWLANRPTAVVEDLSVAS